MIPKKFHRIWFGTRERPQRYDDYWQMWQDMHPDWEFHTWNEYNMPALFNGEAYMQVAQTAKSGGVAMSHERAVAVMRADIVAYELVYNYGGVYLNCDMMPLKPFDSLLGSNAFLGLEDSYHVCNAVMGGKAGHKFYGDVINMLPTSLRQYENYGMECATGPQHMTRVLRSGSYDVDVLPEKAFYPVHHSQIPYGTDTFDQYIEWGRQKDAYAVHMWGHRYQEGRLHT